MKKFSILLPTRNRLQYLRYAISTVLQQDYAHWEIIVSDNDSEEDILGYLNCLGEERIKYVRTQSFLPVTDNWNHALAHSTGDYIIMLGDDDGLRKGHLRTVAGLLEQFESPDLLYSSALLYAYPGLFKNCPGTLHEWGNAAFLKDKTSPFLLNQDEARQFVQQSMGFKVVFNYNMQFSVVSRDLIQKLQSFGPFFQSPYPDYYATTVMLLNAQRILAVPQPLAIISICPKSFGWQYFNNKESEGVALLNPRWDSRIHASIKKYLMPGTEMNSSWLMANETVRQNFGEKYKLRVNYKKYRFIQYLHFLMQFAANKNYAFSNIWKLRKHMNVFEYVYVTPLALYALVIRYTVPDRYRVNFIHRQVSGISHPPFGMKKIEGHFDNILDVFEKVPSTVV